MLQQVEIDTHTHTHTQRERERERENIDNGGLHHMVANGARLVVVNEVASHEQ